jgi:hypothetical protein
MGSVPGVCQAGTIFPFHIELIFPAAPYLLDYQQLGAPLEQEVPMKHQDINTIGAVADVVPFKDKVMSRKERLERWAQLIEQHKGMLVPLHQIEFLEGEKRRQSRHDASPIALAHNDPVLREEGLKGDTLGDAVDFFELSDSEAHRLLCDCHYYSGMTTDRVADQLHRMASA